MKRMTYAEQRNVLLNMAGHMTVDAMFELLNQPQHKAAIRSCPTMMGRKRKVLAICRKNRLRMQYVQEIVDRVFNKTKGNA